MIKTQFDVIIIGAGPAGSFCAHHLAHTRLNIAIIDKATFPRHKICGGALGIRSINALREAPNNLFQKFIYLVPYVNCNSANFISPNNNQLTFNFATENNIAPSFIINRYDFDNFLLNELKYFNNISFIDNTIIKNLTIKNNSIYAVSSTNQTFIAKLIIVADGFNSLATKYINNKKNSKQFYFAIRGIYKKLNPCLNIDSPYMYYLKKYLPGYFWIFPMPNNMINAGLVMPYNNLIKHKLNSKQEFLECIKNTPSIYKHFKNFIQTSTLEGTLIPINSKNRYYNSERLIVCGDAASLADPLLGEGIANALRSGEIAAKQTIKYFQNNCINSSFLNEYSRIINHRIIKEIKKHYFYTKLIKQSWLLNFFVHKANSNSKFKSVFENFYTSKRTFKTYNLRLLFFDVLTK